jgi:1,4-dihydroxy-2-naphthoyl-CoA synthase
MSLHTVLYETRGPIAVLTLNRPDELNAIDARMVVDLGGALDRAEADAGIPGVQRDPGEGRRQGGHRLARGPAGEAIRE